MASNEPSNNSVYKSSGGFQNFVHSYGGKMWNDADVQEAKSIGAAMKQYDSQQGSRSGGSAKSSGGSAKSGGGSARSSGGSSKSSGGAKSSSGRK